MGHAILPSHPDRDSLLGCQLPCGRLRVAPGVDSVLAIRPRDEPAAGGRDFPRFQPAAGSGINSHFRVGILFSLVSKAQDAVQHLWIEAHKLSCRGASRWPHIRPAGSSKPWELVLVATHQTVDDELDIRCNPKLLKLTIGPSHDNVIDIVTYAVKRR
jgi:hypothetical protein